MNQHGVRPLGLGDSNLIGRIIADGFADDAVNLWAFNSIAAMKPAFTVMARHLYLKRGFGHYTQDAQAGTLWLRPGTQKTYGLGNVALAQTILRHGGVRGLRNSLAIDACMSRHRAAYPPHYYLFAIAVDPLLQGKGMGGQLMREALTEVDKARMPAYLENSKAQNIGFYRNHGFEIEREITAAPGCPSMWLMWRPATNT